MRAISKTLNEDVRELSFWLNAKKIALNVVKTEIILFKISKKIYDAEKWFMHPRMLNILSLLSVKT